MIQKSSLNAETVRQLIDSQLEERLLVCPRDGKDFNCEVVLPLHWSDGDVVSVFIGERNGLTIVHDACKIKEQLFRAGERGVSQDELENVEGAVKALEVQFDQNTGIAFAEVDPENLLYWLMEMGRIMTMVPHMYPQPSVEKLPEGRRL